MSSSLNTSPNSIYGQNIRENTIDKLAYYSCCLLAFSVSFGVAMVSISCLFVVLSAGCLFIRNTFFNANHKNQCAGIKLNSEISSQPSLNYSCKLSSVFRQQMPWTIWAIGFGLGWILISIFWTISAWSQVGVELIRSSRLLVIPFVFYLIEDQRRALGVINIWVVGQVIVIISSYLLWMGLSTPWATSDDAIKYFTPYTTTLDQPIMSSVTFGVVWYLREHFASLFEKLLNPLKGFKAKYLVYLFLSLIFINVSFLMIGRSGMLSIILVITILCWVSLPKIFRKFVIFVPFLIFVALFTSSTKFHDRIIKIPKEIVDFQNGNLKSSQAIRLEFWHRSIQAISDRPILGYGVGSWPKTYKMALNGEPGIQADSPHQQFLLWWVEEGTIGLIFLISIYLGILFDSFKLDFGAKYSLISTLSILFFTSLMNCPLQGAGISEFFGVLIGTLLSFNKEVWFENKGTA